MREKIGAECSVGSLSPLVCETIKWGIVKLGEFDENLTMHKLSIH
jgi:hypothetical protein